MNTVIHCNVDTWAQPMKTDHFPIITILELQQERIKPKPGYNFWPADWSDILENLSIRLTEIPGPAPLRDDISFQRAVNDLTEVLQDMIRTRVKIKRPIPQSWWWWNSNLDNMRKDINRLSSISYRYQARDDHPIKRAKFHVSSVF